MHLAVICFFLGAAALSYTIVDTMRVVSGKWLYLTLLNISEILFGIGHWKFVMIYFVSAVDTKNIFW
jgi:hypothetical protein